VIAAAYELQSGLFLLPTAETAFVKLGGINLPRIETESKKGTSPAERAMEGQTPALCAASQATPLLLRP